MPHFGPTELFIQNLGATEILIIAVVVMVLFGAARLPKAAGSIATSLRIFKKEMRKTEEDEEQADAERAEKAEKKALPPGQPDTEASPRAEQAKGRNDAT